MRRKQEKFPLRMLVLITQIGITMMVPIFFCAWMGSLVAEKTGVEIVFVLFLLLGIMAGFRSCYSIIRRFVSLKSTSLESTLVRSQENRMSRAEREKRLRGGRTAGTETTLSESTEDDPSGERPDDPWDR